MSHPALTRLRALRYFAVMPSLAPPLSDWLLLEDSMTQRYEKTIEYFVCDDTGSVS